MHTLRTVAAASVSAGALTVAVLVPAHAARPATEIASTTCSSAAGLTVAWTGPDPSTASAYFEDANGGIRVSLPITVTRDERRLNTKTFTAPPSFTAVSATVTLYDRNGAIAAQAATPCS